MRESERVRERRKAGGIEGGEDEGKRERGKGRTEGWREVGREKDTNDK